MFARTWHIVMLAIVCTLSMAQVSHASASDIKREIQSICNQADSAAARRDVNAAVAMYGDPTLQNGVRQGLQQLIDISTNAIFSTKVISITVPRENDFEAIVVVRQHFQGFIKHKAGVALGVSEAKVRQYWTKKGNQWIILKARVLTIHRTLNSKSVSNF